MQKIHDNPPYFYIMSGFPHMFSTSFHRGSGVGWPFSNQCSSNDPWGGSGRSSRITMEHPWISIEKMMIEKYRISIYIYCILIISIFRYSRSFSPINIIYIWYFSQIIIFQGFDYHQWVLESEPTPNVQKSWTLEPRDLKPLRHQLVELFNTIQLHQCSLSTFLQTSGIHILS